MQATQYMNGMTTRETKWMNGKYSPTTVLFSPHLSALVDDLQNLKKDSQDLPEVHTIRFTRWPDDVSFEEDRGDPGQDDQEEG